jgi:hypothetical protein
MTIWEDDAPVTSPDEDQALAKAVGVRIAKANKIEAAARLAKAAQEEATRRAIAQAAQEEANRTAIARAAQAAQEEAKAKQEEADQTAKEESERLEKEQAKAKQEEADRTAKERDKLAAKKEADRTAKERAAKERAAKERAAKEEADRIDRMAKERVAEEEAERINRMEKERAAKEEADHQAANNQLEDLAVVISTSSDASSSLPESYESRAARAQDILHSRRGPARPPRGDFLPPEAIACGQPKRGNDIGSTATEEASTAMVVDGDPPVIHDPKRVRLQSQVEIMDSIEDDDL